MGFQQGLSGLNAASKQLDVVGNNIANANTYGFKSSRAEFGDIYGNSFYGVASSQAGIGVQTQGVALQITQGPTITTNNNLDLAIQNNGFFMVRTGVGNSTSNTTGTMAYTRNGAFQVDNQGYIVNNGNRLQGWAATSTGQIVNSGTTTADLQLQTALVSAAPTSAVGMQVTLDSRSTVPTTTPFSASDPTSYNWSNGTTVFDSLGNPHALTFYYVKGTPTATGTPWSVYTTVDGTAVATTPTSPVPLSFNTSGAITGTTATTISYTPASPNGAAQPMSIAVDFAASTQLAQSSGSGSITNDGYASGTVQSISISNDGIIQANYTNNQTKIVGQIVLATFTNQQGLQPIGDNLYGVTNASGAATPNAPGTGTAGTLRDSALESSNVDLTTELVNLITAQRYYQANAQTIKAEDTIQQTLINI